MKKLLSILLTLALVLSLAACGGSENTESAVSDSTPEKLDTVVNVYGINGPTGIGLVSLMKKADEGNGNLKYNFKLAGDNSEIVAKISNNEADIAAVATNVASTLYKKTNGNVVVLAANTLGVLSVVTKGEEITSIADLKGKTIYSTGQGANPEFIITQVLEENGLKVGTDVKVEFTAQPQELVTKVVTNEKAIVIAPQPVATMITIKDSNAKIVIDINDEWDKISDTQLTMGCIIARKEFVEKNPDAVKIFLKEYKASVEAVSNDTEAVAKLCEDYKIVSPAAAAKKAIPYCNIVYQDGEDLKTNLSAYLNFLFEKAPATVGGALPNDDFYYNAK